MCHGLSWRRVVAWPAKCYVVATAIMAAPWVDIGSGKVYSTKDMAMSNFQQLHIDIPTSRCDTTDVFSQHWRYAPVKLHSLSSNAQGVLNESMSWMDGFYDTDAGYLYSLYASAALRHDTRSSAWYAIGLLARNEGDDVANAEKILTAIVDGQYKDPAEQWFGDYQKEPEEPYVGTEAYPADIYDSWDPNWRGFIGTTFIIGLEEFPHLLSKNVTDLILGSLHNSTVGDSYRVGGVDDDNLYPAYSNPSIMRAFVSGWTGRRLNDSNFTMAGEQYAQEIVDLFTRADTLSEFNSGTYTGVSLFGLTLWAKYLPADSIMTQYGERMIKATWEAVGQLWHPELRNMAGPWDRSYGFDMNRYFSLMALWFWIIMGKEKSSLISRPQIMSHSADFAYGPLFAVLGEFQASLVPEDVLNALQEFRGEHIFNSSTFSPPFDTYLRNITTWLASNISIGAETFDENVIGGPAINPSTFNPAVIQWNTGKGVGFITIWQPSPYVSFHPLPTRSKRSDALVKMHDGVEQGHVFHESII
ncbi:hypothetical protein D6C99_08286 [Aureobasidium pullulans]|nr:hypothetical protein D6C99_08286 [Aureobasidium pullulans]